MEGEVPKETPSVVVVSQTQPERKPVRLSKWHVIAVVLVAVTVVQGFLYVSLNSRYDTLNANHKSLTSEHQNLTNDYDTLTNQYSTMQSEHIALQGSYDSLQTNYSSLRTDYSSLQTNHSSLQTQHALLQSAYNSLQSNYSTLQSDYGSLQSKYNSLQTSYSTLQSAYDSLQSAYHSYVSSYNNLRNQINKRTLQFSVTDFITPNDPSVQDEVYTITGGWSNTSDWNEYWTDTKMVYDWVVNNIEYRSDGLYPVIPSTPSGSVEYRQEMWQLPQETLDLKQGDCEDMAILLTSMIQSYDGGKYWTECILITGANGGHAGVQMPVEGGKLTILDPAGNYYTQTSGTIDQKDISTEISNWLNYWKPQMGSNVYIDRVFSNNLDKSFSSTSEYTTWMYSR